MKRSETAAVLALVDEVLAAPDPFPGEHVPDSPELEDLLDLCCALEAVGCGCQFCDAYWSVPRPPGYVPGESYDALPDDGEWPPDWPDPWAIGFAVRLSQLIHLRRTGEQSVPHVPLIGELA